MKIEQNTSGGQDVRMTIDEFRQIHEAIELAMTEARLAYWFSPGSYAYSTLIACQNAHAIVRRLCEALAKPSFAGHERAPMMTN
jgi:hypothetical protein